MRYLLRSLLTLSMSLVMISCADLPIETSDSQIEFDNAAQRLNKAYGGEGKADATLLMDPCSLFEPILQ